MIAQPWRSVSCDNISRTTKPTPMKNPLLDFSRLPDFANIGADHAEPAVDETLARSRSELAALLDRAQFNWQGLAQPLEEIDDRLRKTWSPVTHLNAVMNNAELRDAYNKCLEKISEFTTELGQNHDLFTAFKDLAKTDLNPAQEKLVSNAIRNFRLAGVDLPDAKKDRYKEIQSRLSALGSKFSEHVLDATNAWSKSISDADELRGVSSRVLKLAAKEAESRGQEGWCLTLDFPTYFAILSKAENRGLREEFYTAWCTRASDRGPHAGQFDNTPLMTEILELRQEKAELLGFSDFTEYSLATKMAPDPDTVIGFLRDLVNKSKPAAAAEFEALTEFANRIDGLEELQPWDTSFYAEKLRKERFDLSDEELRPYFPLPVVLEGMFNIVRLLYGVQVVQEEPESPWHEDVRFFRITDETGEEIGGFFADIFTRAKKRGGAWMDECLARKDFETLQRPVAHLVCNFMPPNEGEPALLTHDEVLTLFHEFGHCLHHLLTEVDYPSVGGISGVAWDAVELPSQFMENFAWSRETLPMISAHFKTGEAIPEEKLDRLLNARVFHSALQMVRQLEFALFDFRIHREAKDLGPDFVGRILDEVRAEVSVTPNVDFNRFPNSFSHIFSGGYAAGYYSYKWAEVLSADAFSAFEDNGILDATTGRRFRQSILAVGGTVDAMDAFVDFRGRKPSVEPLLRHSGLTQ